MATYSFVELAAELDSQLNDPGILPDLNERRGIWAGYHKDNNVKFDAKQDVSGI